MTIRSLSLALVLGAALAGTAEAASITFNNESFASGSGIGNVPTILVIQDTPDESGGVYWTGTHDALLGNDAKPQSQTWTVTSLAGIGITSADTVFGLVFNLNETNPHDAVSLAALELNFFDAAGNTLFSAPYVGALPLPLVEANQGTGSSGFLFRVALTPDERNDFFGTPTNRLGMWASVHTTDSGQETFYLAELDDEAVINQTGVDPVPEPTSMVLLGTGLAGLVYQRVRRRK